MILELQQSRKDLVSKLEKLRVLLGLLVIFLVLGFIRKSTTRTTDNRARLDATWMSCGDLYLILYIMYYALCAICCL